MESDITDSLKLIVKDIDSKLDDETVAQKSYRILVQFNKYLEEEEVNPITLDNYMLFIFNEDYGITRFIKSVCFKSIFRKSKIQCLELLYLLVNNFSTKIEKYFVEMKTVCLSILRTSQVSSDEKVKALLLLYLMLEKFYVNFQYTNDYVDVFNTLFYCFNDKLGDSISEKVYECLGLYIEKLDYTLEPSQICTLQKSFINKIRTESRGKNASKKLIAGLFNGLMHMQKSPCLDHIKDELVINDLYSIIKTLIQDALKNRIKIQSRAALLFLHKNLSLFDDHLYKDHNFWHKTLGMWISNLGNEEKKLASKAILSIYKCITDHLMKEKKAADHGILKKYLISFRILLDTQTSTNLEKQTCIHGIRIFFEAAPALLNPQEVHNFSLKLLHTFRLTYIIEQDFDSDEWSLLPDYIQMVTSVMVAKGIEREEILLLKQSLTVLLKHYTRIPILNRFKVNQAFMVAVQMVKKYDFFEQFLDDLIYHCVILSCSHQHISEIFEENTETVTVLSYLPFWKDVLHFEIKNFSEDPETDPEGKHILPSLIVKNLVHTLFICVDKLDVTLTLKEEYHTSSMKKAVDINKKDDFAIFLNVIDFYEHILPIANPKILMKYFSKLLNFFMQRSMKFPLVSGFYRLLAACLKIANKQNFFDDYEGELLVTLSKYMRHLVSTLNQYEDELLISCLKLLLECPPSIIEGMLPSCVSAFVTLFSIGRQYLPVADLGIQTLQKWQGNLNHDLMEEFLGKIMFKLDAILRSKSLAYSTPEYQKPIRSNRALRKRKMAVEIEPELVELQRKVVRFLGKQTGPVCEKMLDGQRFVTDVWSDVEHLKVTLPFPNSKFDLRLDRMVPLVVELSLYSSDRKTRVTACELLQALVVFFLGTTKQMTNKEQTDLVGVLKKFSPAILELGCDPDEVIRGLFEPLVLQMIHWYSAPVQSGKCHTAVILEALIEGVCSSTNANLRSFSGQCVGEFVKWTIKQSTELHSQQKNLNIKTLTRKIRYLSTHPDNFKKLGSVLIFNNCYVHLREDRSLMNVFWIEFFEIFVTSLHFIEDNADNKPIVAQIFVALRHLQRGFTEKGAIFKTKDEKRRKPHGFEDTTSIDVLNFLVQNVGSKNSLCREKSAELFFSLSPFLSDARFSLDSILDTSKWMKLSSYTSEKETEKGLDQLIFLLKNANSIGSNLEEFDIFRAISFHLESLANIRKDHFESIKKENRIDKKILIALKLILDKNCEIESLWNKNLWCFLKYLLFNLRNSLEENEIKEELRIFLKSANNNLPSEKLIEMNEIFVDYIKTNFSDDFELTAPISLKQKKTINGMLLLKECGGNEINNSIISLYPKIVQKFVEKCLKSYSLYLNEEEVSYFSLVLEFGLENEFQKFVESLYHQDKIDELETRKKISVGSFLMDSFGHVIVPKIFKKFGEFLHISTSRKEYLPDCVSYIKNILTYISRFKENFSWADKVEEKLSEKWNCFEDLFKENFSKLVEGLEIIKLLNTVKRSNIVITPLILPILKNREFLICENKMEVLEFLFKHIDSSTEERNASILRSALDQIYEEISQQNDESSRNLYLMKISRLYHVLEGTRSILLFEFILKLYQSFSEFEQHMKDISVFEKYIRALSEKDQIKIMTLLVNKMKNLTYSNGKLGVEILTLIFQKATLKAFESYFLDNVKSILDELEEPFCENNLSIKIIDYILVGILFVRVPIGKDNDINEKLQQAALPEVTGDHKELLRSFLKCTLNKVREEIRLNPEKEELLRICRCHCYNTLVSIAVNVLNDPRFHVKLFTREDGNEDILWKNIVDLKKTFIFEKDFSKLPQKRKISVNIKRNNETTVTPNFRTKVLRSQRIFNSSLAEDITKHDFNNAVLRPQSVPEKEDKSVEIEIDYVQVNYHECMPTICALINHLYDVYFRNSAEEIPEIPPCFRGLRNVLLNETTPINVRIFLVKVIENTSHVFVHYSKWFLAPVMKFIVDKCAGNDMNFFITDLVVMLANWSEKAQPQDQLELDLATEVIKFLFENLSTERRDVFRYNLELIGILVEAWKTSIRISEHLLKTALASTETEETDREIQFFSLLLHNDLFIFETEIITEFLKFVNKRLVSSLKAIYVPCSEMLGIFLKKWKEKDAFASYQSIGMDTLINRAWEKDRDKGGYILEGIIIHHPEFLQEKHIIRMLSRLGGVIQNSQYTFLKVMLRATFPLECINEFRTENWEKYINSESSEVQLITISLIKKNLSVLENEPSFVDIISEICQKKTSSNELCKKLALDVAMEICSEHFKDPSRFRNVADLCKEVLIDSLADENQEVAESVRHFWISCDTLSENLGERFVQVFSLFYKPKNEDVVLGNGVNLIFSLLKSNPDFDRVLFEHPLEDCNFEEYELSVNQSTQSPYEIPMFAETFLSNSSSVKPTRAKFGELMETQSDFTFSATMSSRQDEAISQVLSSQSSLLLDSFSNKTGDFKDPNVFLKGKISKRRFLKCRSKISEFHANVEVKSQIQKHRNRFKRAKERDRRVFITRKYRKGDFPDIQIQLSSIVEPLQKLASENSDVAKIFYTNLFDFLKDRTDYGDWSRLAEVVSTIFKDSLEFNTNLMRTLMDFVIASDSRIRIDPYVITECCLSSSLVSTGTLILENCLMSLEQDAEPQAKRIKGVGSGGESAYWIKLAELYKELNEWDVVCSIFQNKVPCSDLLKTAISKESKKLWPTAKNLYQEAITKDLTEDKKDFYYEAYFRCFANMGQWQKISETIKETEGDNLWNTLWEDDWKRKKLLPWYMTSEVNQMLYKEQLSTSFLKDINAVLSENRKAEHLKLNFPELIATMWMLNEDTDSAEMYLRASIDSFLGQWQILDPIFRGIRCKKLLKLRSCTTIYEFIDIYRMFGSVEIERIFEKLELLWSNTRCDISSSTLIQEVNILYHKQFLSLFKSKIQSLDDPEYNPYIERIKNWKLKLDLGIVDAALNESNFHLAKKYLEQHRREKGIDLYMAKMMFTKSHLLQNPLEISKTMIKSLNILKDFYMKEISEDDRLKVHLSTFEILQELSSILVSNKEIQDQMIKDVEQVLGQAMRSPNDLLDYGASKIHEFLEDYFISGSKEINDNCLSSSYLTVAYYLIEKERPDADILNKMVLRSMKLGDAEARQLFPVLLQQENLGSSFKQESNTVPTWMFLSWIPQLLANMSSDIIYSIDSILMRIAENYPQAIMYPYRLSREYLNMKNVHLSEIVEKMDTLLLNEDCTNFLKALGNVCLPGKKLLYYVDKMRKNEKEIKNILTFLQSELFEETSNQDELYCFQGNTFKKIRSFKNFFTDFEGDELMEKLAELSNKLEETEKSNSLLLKDYSPWLANFSSIKRDMDLEIPGQYDGKRMPLPQYHVKIYKFHPEISVMSSLRKPIKLTILGNDTKEYSYLVKFGEDIRQDQRIEQLFEVMNDVFLKSSNHSQRIALKTFEVVPLTTCLGLIRWIEKTTVMDAFMRRCMKNKGKAMESTVCTYSRFIFSSKRGAKTNKEAYGESARVHDRNMIISNYLKAIHETDKDILRKAFWKLSTSTESYVALRHNFMRSYAVMCVAHWILGIGDRHLSNLLVDLESGQVIGIDFGCAFGTATQMLEVPELIPFRLTPQFVSFMEPLGVVGQFRASMVDALKCLKKHNKLLVATMSVFIKEPSLNWLEVPKMEQSDGSASDWFPNRKIDQVRRKLNGINPKEIFKEDLKDGRVKEYLQAYCDLVDGAKEHDFRARASRDGLSDEEQVDCLIDQSRDYNLLGRTYARWKPWV